MCPGSRVCAPRRSILGGEASPQWSASMSERARQGRSASQA